MVIVEPAVFLLADGMAGSDETGMLPVVSIELRMSCKVWLINSCFFIRSRSP